MRTAALFFLSVIFLGATAAPAADKADVLYDRAVKILHADGEKGLDTALKLFEQAVKADPNFASAYQGVADVLILKYELAEKGKTGWLKDAIAHLDLAINLAPGQGAYYFSRATAYFDLKDRAAGMKDLHKALLANPSDARTHAALCEQHLAAGDTGKAELRAQDAMRRFKEDAESLQIMGTTFLFRGQAKQARIFFLGAERLKPHDPLVLQRLAEAQALEGAHGEAVESYRRAAKVAPKNAQVWFGLASSLAVRGEHDEAIRAMKDFLKLVPGDAAGLNNLALYQEAAGERRDAIKTWSALRKNAGASKDHKSRADAHLKALKQGD